MTYDAIIIGGGLAGLSAAVDLASKGRHILLLEQKPHLGGRTYSFVDKRTGDPVDNGQHLMMGCYHATLRYLRMIGSDHLAALQPNLHIEFLHPQKGFASLRCPPLPAPLHVLVGLLRLKTIPFSHRLRLLRIGTELLASSKQKEQELERLTVDQWLSSLKQTPENRKYLWDILAVGTLNDDPSTVSALLFYRVLKAAFLGARLNSSLLVPKVGLSDLLVDPAEKFIKAHDGEILKNSGADALEIRGQHIDALRMGRKRFKAESYISALPHYDLSALLAGGKQMGVVDHLERFETSPIITLHLWLDQTVIEHEFVATLDSTIQWIFNKSGMYGQNNGGGQYLSLVISGAGKYLQWSKERLVNVAMKELRDLIPAAGKAKILHSLVIKEKRATFSPKPGIERIRPGAATSISNLFLAGDWTATGYPATIEGAVMSGNKAAGEAHSFMKQTDYV